MWEDAEKLFSFNPHINGDINHCDISKTGVIATCSGDRTIKLWKLSKDGLVQLPHSPLLGHSYSVNVVKFSKHGTILASASTDGSAVLWDVKNGEKLLSAYSPSGFSFRTCALSPDSTFFAVGGDDDKVHIWNVATKELVRSISEHEATVNSVCYSPDGHILVSTDLNGKLFGWSSQVHHHTLLFSVMEAHDLGVLCLDFSPQISKTALTGFYTLASCGSDGLVKLWNIEIGSKNVIECIAESFAHVGNAMCVKFSPKGDILATTGGDKCVKLWSYPGLECIKTIQGFSRYVTSCVFDKTGSILIATSRDLQVWIKDSNSGILSNHYEEKVDKSFSEERFHHQLSKNRKKIELVKKIELQNYSDVTTCDIYQHVIAIGTTGSNITLWKVLMTGSSVSVEEHPTSPLKGHTYSVYSLRFSTTGLLVSGSLDGEVIVWNINNGSIIRKLKNPNQIGFRVVQVSSDNETIVAGGDDDLIHIWRDQQYSSIKGHENTVFALDISPDSSILVSGSSDESLKLWDLNTWPPKKLFSMEEVHDLGITCAAFQPVGAISQPLTLASGGTDSVIRIWSCLDPKNGLKSRHTLKDHGSSIMNIRYSNSGEYLGSTAGDRTARIWDTKTYRCLFVFDEHERYVTSCAFSQDNLIFVTTSEYYFKVWKVDINSTNQQHSFQRIPVLEWSSQDVKAWLKYLNIEDRENAMDKINGENLLSFSKGQLEELGYDMETCMKILENIQWLRHGNVKPRDDNSEEDDIPSEFICPITHEIMENPVELSDGFIYEELAIKEWLLTRKQTSPLTNLQLTDCNITSCPDLKHKIQLFLQNR